MPKIRFQGGETKGKDDVRKAAAISIRCHKMLGDSKAIGHGGRYSKIYRARFPYLPKAGKGLVQFAVTWEF